MTAGIIACVFGSKLITFLPRPLVRWFGVGVVIEDCSLETGLVTCGVGGIIDCGWLVTGLGVNDVACCRFRRRRRCCELLWLWLL